MEKGILITLPTSDDVTVYLSTFSKEIISESRGKGIPIKKLEKGKVTKSNFESMLKKLDYKMIVFNGHGSEKSIFGHKNEELVCIGKNESLLRNRITYARSCWAVMELGKKCMEKSEEGCFIGYRIPFMFIMDSTWASNPIKDKRAKIFFETSNLIPLGLIKGHTAEESNENSKRSMLKAINKFLKKGGKDSEAMAETLWNNYEGQEVVGNVEEKLF